MKVDVVIPVRNGEDFILDCLNSVVNQDHLNRIIVVNDGSTDSTADRVNSFAKTHNKVLLYNREPNGLSKTRNFGASVSTSRYLAFLDSDDVWLPTKLKAHFDHLLIHPNCLFSFCTAQNFSKSTKEAVTQGRNSHEECDFDSLLLNRFRVYGSASSVLVDREFFLENGGFDEKLPYGEDWDCWVRLARIQFPCQLEDDLVLIRHHRKSMQRSKSPGLPGFGDTQIHLQVWEKNLQVFQDPRFVDAASAVIWSDLKKNFFRGNFLRSQDLKKLIELFPESTKALGFRNRWTLIFRVFISRLYFFAHRERSATRFRGM